MVQRQCRIILAYLKAEEVSLDKLMTFGSRRLRVRMVPSGTWVFPHVIHSFVNDNLARQETIAVRGLAGQSSVVFPEHVGTKIYQQM